MEHGNWNMQWKMEWDINILLVSWNRAEYLSSRY